MLIIYCFCFTILLESQKFMTQIKLKKGIAVLYAHIPSLACHTRPE